MKTRQRLGEFRSVAGTSIRNPIEVPVGPALHVDVQEQVTGRRFERTDALFCLDGENTVALAVRFGSSP